MSEEIEDRRIAETWQDRYIDELLEKIKVMEAEILANQSRIVELKGCLADIENDAREAQEDE